VVDKLTKNYGTSLFFSELWTRLEDCVEAKKTDEQLHEQLQHMLDEVRSDKTPVVVEWDKSE
jgi:hypothetical protein